jgi:hypothetical protein
MPPSRFPVRPWAISADGRRKRYEAAPKRCEMFQTDLKSIIQSSGLKPLPWSKSTVCAGRGVGQAIIPRRGEP